MILGTAQVIQGNALALPLPDASADLICTSPPYFGLRSYQDGGQHYDGQIGSEATPAEFLDALLAATREMVRVLKPSGSIFVNLGDKYSGGRSGPQGETGQRADRAQAITYGINVRDIQTDIPHKSLMGIPWRYAIACIDQIGLILRAEIIWAKPNGLPESVTDRVRRSHETWFHFVKQPRYFSAVDEIRENLSDNGPAVAMRRVRAERAAGQREKKYDGFEGRTDGGRLEVGQPHPLGKLPNSVWEINEGETWIKIPTPNTANAQNAKKHGLPPNEHGTEPQPSSNSSVWTVPTQPLQVPPELGVDHFAAYPMEWPRRIIQGWTPNGICTACGEGRRPVVATELISKGVATGRQKARALGRETDGGQGGWDSAGYPLGKQSATITGYMCGCPTPDAPTTPAVVLDPFGGTGTTALVAKALGRTGITVDLSADYCRIAEWRTNDPRELAAALQIEKPEPIHPDQLDLFEGAGA